MATSIGITSSRSVSVNALQEGPNLWRGRGLDTRDLEESLRHSPLMHPLIVRAMPGRRNRFEVIAGHRRLKAVKASGQSHIEVRVVNVDDEGAEELSLVENLRRSAIKNERGALARLAALYEQRHPTKRGRPSKSVPGTGLSAKARLAKVIGKSPRMTARLVTVGKASHKIQSAYDRGDITLAQAEKAAHSGQLKLLNIKKTTEAGRGVDALVAALKSFKKERPQGSNRRKALGLLVELKAVLR